jgi:hypothetical protein
MAEITETVCDVVECNLRDTRQFSLFSHTRFNGTNIDTWDYVFDLCPTHVATLLQVLLTNFSRLDIITRVQVKDILAHMNIRTRLR